MDGMDGGMDSRFYEGRCDNLTLSGLEQSVSVHGS